MSTLPYYTTDSLIEAMKRSFNIPVSQRTFQNADFIAFLNEEMSLALVPEIMKMKEDYLLTTVNIPLIGNVLQYEIPYRAAGNKLREIAYRDVNQNLFEMTKINIGNLPYYNYIRSSNNMPYAYHITNNVINLVSNYSSDNGTLEISYYMRPNQLVLLENVGIIQSIDTNTNEVFLDKIPTGYSVNVKYDVVQNTSPHKCLAIDLNITAINTVNKSVTLASLPTGLKVGDHFCLAQTTAIPQIPSDMHPILAQRAGRRCMGSQGDAEAVQVSSGIINEFQENAMTLISDRVDDSPKVIVNNRSPLSRGIFNRRSRFRGV